MPQREQKAQHSLLIAFMFCLAAGPCLVNPHCTPRAPTPLLSRTTENNLMEAASYYCQTGAQSAIDLKEKVFQWLLGLGWCPSSPSLLLKQWILPAGYPLTFFAYTWRQHSGHCPVLSAFTGTLTEQLSLQCLASALCRTCIVSM